MGGTSRNERRRRLATSPARDFSHIATAQVTSVSLASKDASGHADVPSIYLGPIVLFDALKTFEVHLPSKLPASSLQWMAFSGRLSYFSAGKKNDEKATESW